MKKNFVCIFAALAAFILLSGQSAKSQNPEPTVTVVTEPPGSNCRDGGIKVTVTPPPETQATPEPTPTTTPTPEPTSTPTPEPTATPTATATRTPRPRPTRTPRPTPVARIAQAEEPTVTYVCNGQQGSPGFDGFDGRDGKDGFDGFDGRDADSNPALSAPTNEACQSARIASQRLPVRFRRAATVRLTVNAKQKSVKVNQRVIKVDVRKLPCGYYPILVQRRGTKSALYVYRLTPSRIVRQSAL